MKFVDPLEEAAAPLLPDNTVLLGEWKLVNDGSSEGFKVASVEEIEEKAEVLLQTRTIPLEEVKANIEKWRPSIETEYESLVSKMEAVEPLSEEGFQELSTTHVVELIPGKSGYTIQAYTGRLKTRGVGCGSYQHAEKRTKLDAFSGGIGAHSLRLILRNAALRQWKVGKLGVTTAFLNADIVTPNKEVIVVKVPAVFRMIGVKEKYWRVHKALYGLDVSPIVEP